MLSVYFYASRKAKNGLQSRCITCTKIGVRTENISDHVKLYKAEYTRKYKEKKRREKGIPRRFLSNPRFDSEKLYAYLERYLVRETFSQEGQIYDQPLLNGMVLTETDASYLRKLKAGRVTRAPLERIDALCVKYDLPLWEVVEAAGCYKKDVRAARRERRLKKSTS